MDENTKQSQTGPGKAYRRGLTLVELSEVFPTDQAAEEWFIARRWPNGTECPHCGCANVQDGAKQSNASPTVTAPAAVGTIRYKAPWICGLPKSARSTHRGALLESHQAWRYVLLTLGVAIDKGLTLSRRAVKCPCPRRHRRQRVPHRRRG